MYARIDDIQKTLLMHDALGVDTPEVSIHSSLSASITLTSSITCIQCVKVYTVQYT
jgi:hypothetical protein